MLATCRLAPGPHAGSAEGVGASGCLSVAGSSPLSTCLGSKSGPEVGKQSGQGWRAGGSLGRHTKQALGQDLELASGPCGMAETIAKLPAGGTAFHPVDFRILDLPRPRVSAAGSACLHRRKASSSPWGQAVKLASGPNVVAGGTAKLPAAGTAVLPDAFPTFDMHARAALVEAPG